MCKGRKVSENWGKLGLFVVCSTDVNRLGGLSRNEASERSNSWNVVHRLLESVSGSLGGLKCRDKSQ